MSRHAACKLPVGNRPRKVSIKPASINPGNIQPSAAGIIVQVLKVSADVSLLQKNLAAEAAARNELQMTVEMLKAEGAEARKSFAQLPQDHNNPQSLQLFRKALPCKSLAELDWLLAYIENRSLQWTEYVKLLRGSDFNSSIKITINSIMDKSVQKQLSWTGLNTKKPSFKLKYKEMLDGIHVAMNDSFKDYTIAQGEAKIHSLLRHAK